MLNFDSPLEMLRDCHPENSVTCVRPHAATKAAEWFVRNFPGRVLYSVKSNPLAMILDAVHSGGITHFDVASIAEIEQLSLHFPDARLSFMHPVKSPESIRRAYYEFGIRDFSLDSRDELDKILAHTDGAKDLNLFLRLSVPDLQSVLPLSEKFGLTPQEAIPLLFESRQIAKGLGVCFHVGSQNTDANAYAIALQYVQNLIVDSGVLLDFVNVGGGFPSQYPDMPPPPPLETYMASITEAFSTMSISETCELWCEPGRALVAESASVVVRVELRKGNSLYINDGTHGPLLDAGRLNFIYPTRVLRPEPTSPAPLAAFRFFGPTCDSLDCMDGPFHLPDDIAAGDYIEIGMLGAYGNTMRSRFNGFYSDEMVVVNDPPMHSMYDGEQIGGQQTGVERLPLRQVKESGS